MGTHPIFESDFDCLTEYVELGFARAYRKCPARAQSQRSGPGRLGGWFGRVVWDARYCPLKPFRLFAVDKTCGAAVGGVEWGEYARIEGQRSEGQLSGGAGAAGATLRASPLVES